MKRRRTLKRSGCRKRKVHYHVIWSTQHREPLITPRIEAVLPAAIRRKSAQLDSTIYALNAVDDHVHIAVSIALSVAVSKWVQQVKGISTRAVNAAFPDLPTRFRWQRGYGVLTFGKKQLPTVIDYIERQKEHHAADTLIAYLERSTDN